MESITHTERKTGTIFLFCILCTFNGEYYTHREEDRNNISVLFVSGLLCSHAMALCMLTL